MTKPPDISCIDFDQGVDELAVGTLGDPERTRLLNHAAGCPGCEARLNWLAGLADRMLLLVPEVEPPAGFEAGVLARMGGASDRGSVSDPGSVSGRGLSSVFRARKRTWLWLSAVAVALVVLAAGIAVGRTTNRSTPPTAAARQGEVWTVAGANVGNAEVYAKPEPRLLLTLRDPLPWGVLKCQLELAGGQRVTVGSWDYKDSQDGTWAVQIDRRLAGAVLLRIINQQGAVVAKATLT